MSKTQNPCDALIKFFNDVLPSPKEEQAFVGATPYPKKNADDNPSMQHFHVFTHEELADLVLKINNECKDAYFAPAIFMPHETESGNPGRKGEYVRWLKSFWLDIDVGEDKFTAGLGYPTKKEAVQALHCFVKDCNLPEPTYVVDSGGGIHVYWALVKEITPEEWKPISLKLKELTVKYGFLADPARTADMASILRPPFTQNHKLDNPRSVKIMYRKPPIKFSEFADAISTAHATHCEMKASSAIPGTPPDNWGLGTNLKYPLPPETSEEIEQVKAMLAAIPADCTRDMWLNIIWAVADTGWDCAKALAREWSKTAPVKYNKNNFDRDWESFDPKKEGGVTFGTLVHYAKQYGWNSPEVDEKQCPDWLKEINKKYAWIEKDAGIYRLEYGDFIGYNDFILHFKNRRVSVQTKDGPKSFTAGQAWFDNPNRRQHRQLVFRPNEGQVTHDNCLNVWQGFAVKPAPGNVGPFLNLLKRLVTDEWERNYILTWMAHLLQRPEIKMNVSLVLWSHEQGVGKNLLAECLLSIIGRTRHATIIGQSELAGNFNNWANRKVLVIGDEVSSTNRRHDADNLKGLVTGATLYLNEKYQPAREVINLLNFIFLSNHHDALFLNDHDRRYFVWEITAGRLPDAVATEFVKWRDAGGLSALLDFFRNYNISDFNPKAPAPMTAAKQQMINDNRDDLECWLADLFDNDPSQILGREISCADELAAHYEFDTGNKLKTINIVTSTCKRLGAFALESQVTLSNGKRVRALALVRSEYWKEQKNGAWAAEIEKKPLKRRL